TAWATSQRARLRDVVRYHPLSVGRAWPVANTMHDRLASLSYRLQMSDGLSATGVWLKSMESPDDAPLTIVLNDQGKETEAPKSGSQVPPVAQLLERNRQVLVADLLLIGDASPGDRSAKVHF